jgi:putative transposase
MNEQAIRKMYQYKLSPAPSQERELGRVLGLCRSLSNTALEQRITAWQRARVSVSRFQQEAELKDIRAAFPEYASIRSHVAQDVLARLDKTAQAFFRRVQAGEQAGFPRYQARTRYHSFTDKEFGNGATLDNGVLVLAKIGRVAVRWSRPLEGTPKTVTISREADGWSVCCSCADVPLRPLLPTGQETGLDLGLEAFATRSDGTRIFSPGWYRKAAALLAKAHQTVRRQRQDVHHKTALALVRATDVLSQEDVQTANLVRNHHLAKSISDAGWAAFLTILSYKAACAGRRVVSVTPAFTSQLCSGCGVERACIETTTPPRRARGSGRPVGEAWRWSRRRTEHPWGCSPG